MNNKRLSFANFPIPFDHPYTLPFLSLTVSVSAIVYYYLQASHTAELIEAYRQRALHRRLHLAFPQDRYASLQIGQTFVNPFPEWRESTWWDSLLSLYSFCRHRALQINKPARLTSPPNPRPVLNLPEPWVTVPELLLKPTSDLDPLSLSFTWLGQSTCLIRADGVTILTDPVLDERLASTWWSPRRTSPMPWSLEQVCPHVDIVLISHNHIDHIHEDVVSQLGDKVTWYVPLGLRKWFGRRGVQNVVELDWWQDIHHKDHPNTVISSVPALHTSGRYKTTNHSLWCSYIIKLQQHTIFFCGSSRYSADLFKAIGNVYAPITLALLPVESNPHSHFFCAGQLDQAEAEETIRSLQEPTLSLGIHWGTFTSSDLPWHSQRQQDRKDTQLQIVGPGETIMLRSSHPSEV